ncbi:hypothetical protein [Halobacillus campisalis]|uniref:YtxH domain-containing protein n=1 Tax=Halobacillus campisalis TaxID=435909 RepID=A0ABW2JZQ0_9BACI|nr:hypothetical protein [Halobacillus campisalis]
MSETVKERKQSQPLSTGVALFLGFIGGALLRSKAAPDDPSIRKTSKEYVKNKYQEKMDHLNETGRQRYEKIQVKKQALKSEARKDAVTRN